MTNTSLRALAISFLARREYSELGLRNKLLERGNSIEDITSVLAKLIREGLLSDRRFAENYIRAKTQRGYGPIYISSGLNDQGIDQELIKTSLAEMEISWSQLAQRVREKKFGAEIPKDYFSRIKQAHFLKYRGFTYQQIKTALEGAVDFDI